MEKKSTLPLPLSFLFFLLCLLLATSLFSLLARHFGEGSAPAFEEKAGGYDTVILDAGHGGEDGGAVSKAGYLEKDLNLSLALTLGEQLTLAGKEVIYTRTEDILLYDRSSDYMGRKKVQDLAARRAVGDAHPEALFVSIHMNAYPLPQYSGVQLWYSPGHPLSRETAKELQEQVQGTLQPDNRRHIKEAGSGIYLLYHLKNPAILAECGFLSNPEEAEKLNDPLYRQQLSFLMLLAICREG